jgi:hypothetical protein
MDEPMVKDSRTAAGQESSLSSPEASSRDSFPVTVETIDLEATRRLRGHERIVQKVCSLAKDEARARELALLHIDVRPAWSHEYDERTGVVIDAEIQATADERFSYWDAVCERLNELEDSLPPEERRFLNDEVSFVVNRS